MLGRVGRVSPTQTRRSRRLAAIIAIAAIVAAIIIGEVIDQVVNSYDPARAHSSANWATAVSSLAARDDVLIATVATLRNSVGSETRPQLDQAMATLATTTADVAQSVDALGIAPPNAADGSAATTVFDDRARAVASFAAAIGLATGPDHDRSAAASDLVATGAELATSDRTWRRLASSLHKAGSGSLPSSVWDSVPSLWSAASSANYANTLASTALLALTKRLSIVAISFAPPSQPVKISNLPAPPTTTTLPPTTTTRLFTTTTFVTTTTLGFGTSGVSGVTGVTGASGVVVTLAPTRTTSTTTTVPPPPSTSQIPPSQVVSELPQTSSLTVTVVVSNSGSATLDGVEVEVTLSPRPSGASGASPISVQSGLGSIAPGGAVFRALPALSVAGKPRGFLLNVTVSAPGAPSVTKTLQLQSSG